MNSLITQIGTTNFQRKMDALQQEAMEKQAEINALRESSEGREDRRSETEKEYDRLFDDYGYRRPEQESSEGTREQVREAKDQSQKILKMAQKGENIIHCLQKEMKAEKKAENARGDAATNAEKKAEKKAEEGRRQKSGDQHEILIKLISEPRDRRKQNAEKEAEKNAEEGKRQERGDAAAGPAAKMQNNAEADEAAGPARKKTKLQAMLLAVGAAPHPESLYRH